MRPVRRSVRRSMVQVGLNARTKRTISWVGVGQDYLLNSLGSTVQGSGWGGGRSLRSPSSCSSLSHLPEGRRTSPRPHLGHQCPLPCLKGATTLHTGHSCPQGCQKQLECSRSPQRGPAAQERQHEPSQRSRLSQERGVRTEILVSLAS
jgi:hypothetical protein